MAVEPPSMLVIFKLPNKPELSQTLTKFLTKEFFFRDFGGILIKVSIECEVTPKKLLQLFLKNQNGPKKMWTCIPGSIEEQLTVGD